MSEKTIKAGARNSSKDAAEMRAAKQKAQEVVIHLTNAGIEDDPDETSEEATKHRIETSLKVLDEGKIGGPLVVFSDESSPDLTGEFFTKSTYFGPIDEINKINVLYHHGFDPTLQKKSLGIGTIKKMDECLWFEFQLDLADKYNRKIYELAKQGLLKLSSGAVSHLVEKVDMGKSVWIKSWPLAEGSLTPTPAEPRAQAYTIKFEEPKTKKQEEVNMSEENDIQGTKSDQTEAQFKSLNEKLNTLMEFFNSSQGQSIGYVTPDGGADKSVNPSFGDMVAAIWRKDTKRLESIYDIKLNEGDGASGGYTVPPQYINQLMRATVENSIVRPRADVRQLTGREAYFPMMDYSGSFADGSSVNLGGMTMAWVDENETIEDTDTSFRQMHVITHKMARSIPVSNELLRDSIMAIENTITSMFGEAVAYFEDWHFLRGSGVGQPLGIYNAPCLIETGTAFSDPVTLAQILTMYKRLTESSKRNAVWVIHPMLQDNIFALNSTSSGSLPIVQDVTKPALYRLLGLPILFSEKVPEMTSQGGVLLADFSQYLIADSGTISLAMSDHQYFASDQVAIRVTKRVDGQPKWNSTRAVGKGTNSTVSPFIKSK